MGTGPLYLVFRSIDMGASLAAIITVVGLQLGALLAGAIVTETICNWPAWAA